MPFDYLHPKNNVHFLKALKTRFVETRTQEIRERAGLFFRLGYTKEVAIARIRHFVRWEFELEKKLPAYFKDIGEIVESVYKRTSPPGKDSDLPAPN